MFITTLNTRWFYIKYLRTTKDLKMRSQDENTKLLALNCILDFAKNGQLLVGENITL